MSKAELEVVLGTPGPFVPDQLIEGFVGVTVNRSCRCRALTVTLEWYTHGRGNRKTGAVQTVVVFDGDLVAGEKGLYPFTLTVPPGPFSYEGTVVSLGWRVRANADLPWAFDPKTETTIVVVPGVEPLHSVDHGPASLSRRGSNGLGDVATLVVGSLFIFVPALIVGPLSLGFLLACVGQPGLANLFPAVITAGMGTIFTYVGYRVVRPAFIRIMARRRISVFEITVSDTVSPGETVDVRLEITPRSDLLAEEVRVELRLAEVAVSGSGTKKKTHSHKETLASVVLNHAGTLQARRPVTFSGTLTIPDAVGLSFAAIQNSVSYQLVGVVDCPGVFDPEQSVHVKVVPTNLTRGR